MVLKLFSRLILKNLRLLKEYSPSPKNSDSLGLKFVLISWNSLSTSSLLLISATTPKALLYFFAAS